MIKISKVFTLLQLACCLIAWHKHPRHIASGKSKAYDIPMNHIFDVIVIGGGPAGMYCAYICRMIGLDCILLEGGVRLGGQCNLYPEKMIHGVPGHGAIQAKTLISNVKGQLDNLHTHFIMTAEVKDYIKQEDGTFTVILNNRNLRAKKIVMAIGPGAVVPKRPDLHNITELESTGFVRYSVSNVDDFVDKTVVVAGGGDSAADIASQLGEVAKKVYVIYRGETMRARPELVPNKPNIALLGKRMIVSADPGAIHTEQEKIVCDACIVCYGMQVAHNFAGKPEFNSEGKIDRDPGSYESKTEGIYAIGACGARTIGRASITGSMDEAAAVAYNIHKILKGDNVPYSTNLGL